MNVAEPPTPVKARILYVITKANWGGAQRYVYDLACAAKDQNHEVAVAYGVPGELVERLQAASIGTIPLQSLERDIRLTSEFSAFISLIQVLRKERPDVVHINSSKAGALGALAARIVGVRRIVFTAHAWAFNEARPVWQKFIFKVVHAITIMLSHYTICVSSSIRHDMRWVPGASRKLIVIHNGVREPVYKIQSEARNALWPERADAFWIGMLSELHPSKRIEDAIAAVKKIRSTHPQTQAVLVVLGEGEEKTRLEEIIKTEGLEDSVRLAGFVQDGPSYLYAFDIFLHTSRTDALAYAVIEAGLAGLPIVATRVGGIPEVIKNRVTGRLVSALHPEEIALALEAYIEDPAEAEKIGLAAHNNIQERFSMEKMIEKTLALYVNI